VDLKNLFDRPSGVRQMKADLQERADFMRKGAMLYELDKVIKAGWCEGGPGDQVELDEFQAAALRHHHGHDCMHEVSPAAETPQDAAPAAGSESPGKSSDSAPAGAPPLEEGEEEEAAEDDLDGEDRSAGGTAGTGEPLNRMVSHSGRGGGGKSKGGKKK